MSYIILLFIFQGGKKGERKIWHWSSQSAVMGNEYGGVWRGFLQPAGPEMSCKNLPSLFPSEHS